jgi:hypothetical protein
VECGSGRPVASRRPAPRRPAGGSGTSSRCTGASPGGRDAVSQAGLRADDGRADRRARRRGQGDGLQLLPLEGVAAPRALGRHPRQAARGAGAAETWSGTAREQDRAAPLALARLAQEDRVVFRLVLSQNLREFWRDAQQDPLSQHVQASVRTALRPGAPAGSSTAASGSSRPPGSSRPRSSPRCSTGSTGASPSARSVARWPASSTSSSRGSRGGGRSRTGL